MASSSSSSSSSLMASQTLILQNPTFFLHPHSHRPSILSLSKPKSPFVPKSLRFSFTNPKKTLILASSSSSSSTISPIQPAESLLTGSTRTITTLIAIAVTVSKVFAQKLSAMAVNSNLQKNVLSVTGPLFFATMSGRSGGRLHTPLTVVAAGMAKWLDIYSGVLLVRVLLSWFPNIPWDRQPLSAIRDLCDPYLNLFRNIIPPLFDTLDVSPLLAFAVLGLLSGIMSSSKMA